MNSKLKLGTAGLVAAALAALALTAPAAAYADSATAPVVGSAAGQTDEALYVLDPESGEPLPAGSSVAYSLSVVGGPSATDPLATIQPPAGGASQAYTFISPRGQERTYSAWNTYSLLGSGTEQALVPIGPSGQVVTGTGTPAGTAAVATAGGDYSLGVAWVTSNAVLKVAFAYISVVPGNIASTTFTFSTPAAAAVAPAITTQPTSTSVNPGSTATFTAAATGNPTPTVQWQTSTNGTSWTNVAGATSATLSVANTTEAQTGTQYRAVFTNTAGSATSNAATLTVNRVAPNEPTDAANAATKVTIAAPAAGATTVVVPAGGTHANGTLQAWAWSDPTNLGQVTTDGSGNATVNIAGLPAGQHTIALTQPGDATFTVVAWGTVEVLSQAGDPLSTTTDLQATVTASDLWSLEAEKTAIDFGTIQRDQSSTRTLGKVTVVDDRNDLKGWNLDASWSPFTAGTDEIATSALTIAPKAYTGYTLIDGVSLGTTANKIAESSAVSTLAGGALFDADLTFKAPKDAKVGEYHSTLTLTLTSK